MPYAKNALDGNRVYFEDDGGDGEAVLWVHHKSTTSAWRSTVVGALRKALRFALPRSMAVNRRIPDRSENHGVPMMPPS